MIIDALVVVNAFRVLLHVGKNRVPSVIRLIRGPLSGLPVLRVSFVA